VRWQERYDWPAPSPLQFVYRGVTYRKDVMPKLWELVQREAANG